MSKGTPQAIIISGESGSGKTEATKKCLQYLSTVAPVPAAKAASSPVEGKEDNDISKRVLATNPLLEAFGNAKTVRNDNSSRFGKLLKAQFTKDRGELVGACIVSYLLEKSRITRQNAEERNFHIFFQLCAALPEPARTVLGIAPSETFAYLASSVKCPSIDDTTDFEVRWEDRRGRGVWECVLCQPGVGLVRGCASPHKRCCCCFRDVFATGTHTHTHWHLHAAPPVTRYTPVYVSTQHTHANGRAQARKSTPHTPEPPARCCSNHRMFWSRFVARLCRIRCKPWWISV